jgi:hypothetical protein
VPQAGEEGGKEKIFEERVEAPVDEHEGPGLHEVEVE